jgi:hypothetical protein
VKIPVVFVYVVPSILNDKPVVDELTVMVPVAREQVGCAVTLAVGADGAGGLVKVALKALLPAGQSVLLIIILV